MTFNLGELMFNIIKILKDLASKLYDVINYQVDISFVRKTIEFFGGSTDMPNTISLLAIVGGIGVATLVGIIIYNIFKF